MHQFVIYFVLSNMYLGCLLKIDNYESFVLEFFIRFSHSTDLQGIT